MDDAVDPVGPMYMIVMIVISMIVLVTAVPVITASVVVFRLVSAQAGPALNGCVGDL
jgi:hypothetical protein